MERELMRKAIYLFLAAVTIVGALIFSAPQSNAATPYTLTNLGPMIVGVKDSGPNCSGSYCHIIAGNGGLYWSYSYYVSFIYLGPGWCAEFYGTTVSGTRGHFWLNGGPGDYSVGYYPYYQTVQQIMC